MDANAIFQGWFFLIAAVGMGIQLANFCIGIMMFCLYHEFIPKLEKDHPDIVNEMKIDIPFASFWPTVVDSRKLIHFLDNNHNELSPRVTELKRRYKRLFDNFRKLMIAFAVWGVVFFISAVVTITLAATGRIS